MLFGVEFCRGCGKVRKKNRGPCMNWRIFFLLAAAGLLAALLFIAPQWLLVLLVMILTCAVIWLAVWKR